jgi:hypothetical protein
MSGPFVVVWILGGNAIALLLLNALFSKGTSSMGGRDVAAMNDRLPPAALTR